MTEEEYHQIDGRRFYLIKKKAYSGLTPDEALELAELQQWFNDYITESYPHDLEKLARAEQLLGLDPYIESDPPERRYNPFPEGLTERLHLLNNTLSTTNKTIREIKQNLKGMAIIQDKNPNLDLTVEIAALEEALLMAEQELISSGIQKRLADFNQRLEILKQEYTTHEAIRRQRFQDYLMKACYPPWDIVYDKVAALDGEVHVIGDEISSFIVPERYREEFLDFIEGLSDYQYQGEAPKKKNSYLIKYRRPANYY